MNCKIDIKKEGKMFISYLPFEPRTEFNIPKGNIYAKLLENAKISIIVCGDKVLQGMSEFLIEDCSAATQNMLLAIHSIGLGGVWCGAKQNTDLYKYIVKEFKIPEHIRPISLIALGQINEKKVQKDRFETNKVHYETW